LLKVQVVQTLRDRLAAVIHVTEPEFCGRREEGGSSSEKIFDSRNKCNRRDGKRYRDDLRGDQFSGVGAGWRSDPLAAGNGHALLAADEVRVGRKQG
jgi:hypothetical protein